MTYDNTNTGVLFTNDKQGNDKRPDYTGRIDVGGTEYQLAGWIRESSRDGKKFLSLKIQDAEKQTANVPAGAQEDDDIPF